MRKKLQLLTKFPNISQFLTIDFYYDIFDPGNISSLIFIRHEHQKRLSCGGMDNSIHSFAWSLLSPAFWHNDVWRDNYCLESSEEPHVRLLCWWYHVEHTWQIGSSLSSSWISWLNIQTSEGERKAWQIFRGLLQWWNLSVCWNELHWTIIPKVKQKVLHFELSLLKETLGKSSSTYSGFGQTRQKLPES